jgi:hypothetical protein
VRMSLGLMVCMMRLIRLPRNCVGVTRRSKPVSSVSSGVVDGVRGGLGGDVVKIRRMRPITVDVDMRPMIVMLEGCLQVSMMRVQRAGGMCMFHPLSDEGGEGVDTRDDASASAHSPSCARPRILSHCTHSRVETR